MLYSVLLCVSCVAHVLPSVWSAALQFDRLLQINTSTGACEHDCDCTQWPTSVTCVNADFEDIQYLITTHLKILHFTDVDFDDDTLPASSFEIAVSLEEFHLIDCDIEYIQEFGNRTHSLTSSLTKLVLHDNDIEEYYSVTRLMQWWPNIQYLDLSLNEFSDYSLEVDAEEFQELTSSLTYLNLSNSELEEIPMIPWTIETLDISHNELEHINDGWLNGSIQYLDMSHNTIKKLTDQSFINIPALKHLRVQFNLIEDISANTFDGLHLLDTLDISHNQVADVWTAILPATLTYFNASHNNLLYFNFTEVRHLERVTQFDISHNHELRVIFGTIFDLYRPNNAASHKLTIDLQHCQLRGVPRYFFAETSDNKYASQNTSLLPEVLLQNNHLACDCQLLWIINRPKWFPNIEDGQVLYCDGNKDAPQITHALVQDADLLNTNCSVGSSVRNNTIFRYKYGSRALVPCDVYSESDVNVRWHVVYPGQVLVEWHQINASFVIHDQNTTEDSKTDNITTKFSILPGGTLVIHNMMATDIERYVCTVTTEDGTTNRQKRSTEVDDEKQSVLIRVRIDYSHYIDTELWSYVIGVVTVMIFFTLHMIWSGIRRFVIWRLEVSERANRLKGVAAAMEKYRQRQLEAIQDKYGRRMEQVRENYRFQAEALRRGYMNQCERFRDYRSTHMETVTTHWDNLKDNYQLQMTHMRENYTGQVTRLRDYGGRQMDRLWEGYERQVNRVRTFSLQHRLKLMRQYKIKGRYMNKILESMGYDDNTRFTRDVAELPNMPKLDTPPLLQMRPRCSSYTEMTTRQMQREEEEQAVAEQAALVRRVHSSVSHRHQLKNASHATLMSSYHSLPALDQMMLQMMLPEHDVDDLFYEYEMDFDDDLGPMPMMIDFERPSTSISRPKSVGQSTMYTANSFVSIRDDPDVRMPLTFFDTDGRRLEGGLGDEDVIDEDRVHNDTVVRMNTTKL